MKKIILCLALIICAFISNAQEQSKTKEFTFRHKGMDRTYWLYIPENLSEHATLVMVLHGYGGKAEGYQPEMINTADKYGFAVCYPQGAKDKNGKNGKGSKNCWNVGYCFQQEQGLKTDDVDFLCSLAKHLQKTHGLKKENTFLTGMSNGGEMCYLMATLRPTAFTAYAPIAGLTMEWSYKKYSPKKAVPMMEVHGTADKTSRWLGDPQNEGQWGAYISVPMAVGIWAAEAKCTYTVSTELPLMRNQVILHRHLGGVPAWKDGPAVEVRLYEIIGGTHSWALKDLATCDEVWKFFSIYLR